MQGKWSKVKNFHHKNVNKRKNRLTPAKLESKKQHEKIIVPERDRVERSHRLSRKSHERYFRLPYNCRAETTTATE